MLSRTLQRVLRETGSALPPTFLLPWTASLSTAANVASTASPTPPPPPPAPASLSSSLLGKETQQESKTRTATLDSHRQSGAARSQPSAIHIDQSVRELLPLLQSQGPHYMTAHIHGNPYLITQGDTVRLPFRMHGVEPGDIIRLDRAVNLGSRDYTLKAPTAAPPLKSPTKVTRNNLDDTKGTSASHTTGPIDREATEAPAGVPHFIPHIAKGKFSYIDDRLFECRAVVMGVESEPLRIKEKTKRRQRHVKTVKSKHRFTILRIKELRIRSLEEIEGNE